jgi:hypothetical protein
VAAGAAFVLAAGFEVAVSGVLLFLQPISNASGSKQQISLGWIFMGCSSSDG